jgi:hypothetical protein
MLKYLQRIMEFLNTETKVKMIDGEFQIDGFKGLLVESNVDGVLMIPKHKFQHLRRILELVSDQPITIHMGYTSDWIEIKHLTL